MSYPCSTRFQEVLPRLSSLESAGIDSVWVGEACGLEVTTAPGAMAITTTHARLGFGVIPVRGRSLALLAMSAAGLDAVSGGHAYSGLGLHGLVVVDRWHDQRFQPRPGSPHAAVNTWRTLWRREPLPDDLRSDVAPRALHRVADVRGAPRERPGELARAKI